MVMECLRLHNLRQWNITLPELSKFVSKRQFEADYMRYRTIIHKKSQIEDKKAAMIARNQRHTEPEAETVKEEEEVREGIELIEL